MFNFSYEEIDLMREMINLKIVDKNRIRNKKNINEKEMKEVISSMNSLLKASRHNQLVEVKDYVFYYGNYDSRRLRMEEIFKFENTIREEIIYLFLLLSRERFNITKFGDKFWRSNDNRKTLKSDLRKILYSMGIDYREYMDSSNPSGVIKSRIEKLEEVKKKYLKKVLLKKWERVYLGLGIRQEKIEVEIIEEALGVRDMPFIYTLVMNFCNNYTKLNSKSKVYDFFVYILLNLHNEEVNTRKRLTSASVKLKGERVYGGLEDMLRKIEKREGIKIYTYFRMRIYKYLLKQERGNGEVFYRNEETEEQMTAEEALNYENARIKEEKETGIMEEGRKAKVLLSYDLEMGEISRTMGRIRKIFNQMEVKEIRRLEELRSDLLSRGLKRDKVGYEYILILSNDVTESFIENYTDIPIMFLNMSETDEKGERKGSFKRNAEFNEGLRNINKMMKAYDSYGKV